VFKLLYDVKYELHLNPPKFDMGRKVNQEDLMFTALTKRLGLEVRAEVIKCIKSLTADRVRGIPVQVTAYNKDFWGGTFESIACRLLHWVEERQGEEERNAAAAILKGLLQAVLPGDEQKVHALTDNFTHYRYLCQNGAVNGTCKHVRAMESTMASCLAHTPQEKLAVGMVHSSNEVFECEALRCGFELGLMCLGAESDMSVVAVYGGQSQVTLTTNYGFGQKRRRFADTLKHALANQIQQERLDKSGHVTARVTHKIKSNLIESWEKVQIMTSINAQRRVFGPIPMRLKGKNYVWSLGSDYAKFGKPAREVCVMILRTMKTCGFPIVMVLLIFLLSDWKHAGCGPLSRRPSRRV